MDAFALAAKALMAVMLAVAGGAKLADLDGFAGAVRLFVPRVASDRVRWIAVAAATSELAVGVASLSWPTAGWLNPVVLALSCGFLAVSVHGYLFNRGRPCRCFGALSRRTFDVAGVLRNMAIVVVALVSLHKVRAALINVGVAQSILLLIMGLLISLAAFTAAHSINTGRRYGLVMQ